MKRADLLNLIQGSMTALQCINLAAGTYHLNPLVTLIVGAIIAGGNEFLHRAAINTDPPK